MSKENNGKKVLVGMSGGVDSSVSAMLLLEQGYEVEGVFMNFWTDPAFASQKETTSCKNAQKVARQLGIKFHTIDRQGVFKEKVVGDLNKGLEKGVTPNPCVRCNRTVKFAELLKFAKEIGADYIATGHYAQIEKKNDAFVLKKGSDPLKDQSYFLYTLNQARLKKILFPVGGLTKVKVKALAKKAKLSNSKGESAGLCFLSGASPKEYVKKTQKLVPGKIFSKKGAELGEHLGYQMYTIGQKAPIGGPDGPWFITDIIVRKNEIIVTNNPMDPQLCSNVILLKNCSWVTGASPKSSKKFQIKIRYGKLEIPGKVFTLKRNECRIELDDPIKAVTPGQSAVVYNKDIVVGGGIIKEKSLQISQNKRKKHYATPKS